MSASYTAERRLHPRTAVQASIRLYHPASRLELPARTLDLSRGGAALHVPPYAPVREGHALQILDLPDLDEGPADGDGGARELVPPLDATVLRVDRTSLPATGRVRLAVRFHQPIE